MLATSLGRSGLKVESFCSFNVGARGRRLGGIITMYDNAAAVDVAWRTMSRA